MTQRRKIKTIKEWKESNLKLFDVQPEYARKPLSDIELKCAESIKRVLFFDPTEIYNRINSEFDSFNPFSRHPYITVGFLFPTIENLCACGCGKELTGRRKRYATDSCGQFVTRIYFILTGRKNTISNLLGKYNGGQKVCKCGSGLDIELDHLHSVAFGGGGGWLSNYEFKCKKCHREKTNSDFGFKTK